MLNALDRFLNLGWNPDHHSSMQMRRLRTLSATALVMVLLGTVFLYRAVSWQIQLRQFTLTTAIVVVLFSMLLLYRSHTDRMFFIASQLVLLAIWIAVEGGVVTSGGIGGVNQAWMVFIPLLAGVTLGRRAAFVWGALVLASVLVIGKLQAMGVAFPNLTPPDVQHSQNWMQAMGLMLGLLVMLSSFLNQLSYSETVLTEQNVQLQRQIHETERAMNEARAAELAKTRFLANMSHELRTPLNVIQGFAKRLDKSLRGRLDEREQSSLRTISQNSANMLQLVEDLFDLAALDSNTLPLQVAPTDLTQLFGILRIKFEPLTAAYGQPIRMQCDQPVQVLADVRRLEQVLTTMVRFCLKSEASGVIDIKASIKGQQAEILVQDRAPPLGSEAQTRLFDRYNHLHSQQERDTGVSGLGMALAWELVRRQGGELTLTDTGEGNGYRLLLPLHRG